MIQPPPQVKIGNGETSVGSLPFIKAGSDVAITTGTTNGTISVTIDGSTNQVAVKGLGSNAYTSTAYLPLIGGTLYNSSTDFPLTIKSNKTSESWIKFIGSNDTTLGYLGALVDSNGTKSPMWYGSQNSIILHAGNFTNYTVTKTGTGASGTWDISISGSSTSCTGNAATASKVNGVIPEWSGQIAWADTEWIAAWTSDGSKIKCLSKGYFALASHTHDYLPLSGGTLTGATTFNENITLAAGKNIILRTHSDYQAGIGYDTQGNECFALWAKNPVTRFRWNAGVDMTDTAYTKMMSITPDFEISKASGSAIGYIGGNTIITTGNISSQTVHSAYYLYYTHTNEINFRGGLQSSCYFNYRDPDTDSTENPQAVSYFFCGYGGSNYSAGKIYAGTVYGAVWNDYAEYRQANSTTPGRVVRETTNGIMELANERLLPACEIISDTFGFAIGETDNCKTPIACTGRVLAYTDKERNTFNIGDAVCSGANGTVSVMTREEICEYPDRIIGYVSEIPQYEVWGTGDVKVDGRIWIRVR